MRLVRTLAGVAGLLGVGCSSTCGDATTSEGVIGELGNGDFSYGCLDRTDPACPASSLGESPPFPDCVVEGGRFDLTYRLIDTSAISSDDISPVLQVVPANEDFLGRGQPFVAQRSGRSAVLVRESGHVVDLLHLDVLAHTEIEISTLEGEVIGNTLQLSRGDAVTLLVRAAADGCFAPGGALPLTVRTVLGLTRSVVRIEASDVIELDAQARGIIAAEVQLGELSRTLTINVVDAPPPGESTGEDPGTTTGATGMATDTGSATATDTDSATDTDTDGEAGSGTAAATGTGTGGG
jgi:hypothetical protein